MEVVAVFRQLTQDRYDVCNARNGCDMAGNSSQLELVVAGLEHLRKLGVGVFL